MARAKKGQEVDLSQLNTIDLGKEMGLTLLSDTNKADIKNILPTMVPQYDRILGGGIPLGRLTEVYGLNASGKSTFAVHLSRITTQLGVITVWIDIEGTADNRRMEQLGVDVSKLFSIQAGEGRLKNTVELSIETVGKELEYWIDTFNEKLPGVPILFIWDSLGGTRTDEEIKGGIDTKKLGIRASSAQKVINAITPKLNETNTGVLIINQARDNLNMSNPYDDPIKSTGGRAFEHAASLRIKVNKGAQIKQAKASGKDEYSGHIMRIETKKSKLSRPNQKAEAHLLSEWELSDGTLLNGLDLHNVVYQEAVEKGLITKGAWRNYITLNGEEIKLRDAEWVPRLKEDYELYLELFKRTYVENFPNGYSPLENKTVDVTQLDEYQALEDYYTALKESDNEQAVEEDDNE
ncbi:recombinase [Staphylococcus phage Twort]|uniref:Recombinase n=2 Tax=Staphylococcus phage Twort (strain DSM 17442 / HER 48) TaxID=2908167 RepID=A0A6H0X5E6_BPTWO|nr:UvsX-like recombinase [Staphylococcus phage Twort]AAX92315.1 ORF019 [Staphylococcus phage Twort]QIW89151.1 recombinase [Staphylococcus phage Twort]